MENAVKNVFFHGIYKGVIMMAITPTPCMALPLFATRFAAYAGGIRVSFIQPRLF